MWRVLWVASVLFGACTDAAPSTDAGVVARDGAPSDTAAPRLDAGEDATGRPDLGRADVGDASADVTMAPPDGTTGTDAGRPARPCGGRVEPLVVSRDLPFRQVRVGREGASGLFLLDLATTQSVIDLAAFDAPPPAFDCDPGALFSRCRFEEFDFFGPWGAVTLTTQNLAGLGGVRQAGILGTDFMSQLKLAFDYPRSELTRADAAACDDESLARAGMFPLSTEGFFSHRSELLRPLRDVLADAPLGTSVPNVPTVNASIAGQRLWLQLDTGFEDSLVPRSLNVNEAFFQALVDSGAALRRAADADLVLTTCAGVLENVEAWRVDEPLLLEGEAGTRALENVVLFVKRTPEAARRCGGIGTWSVPAGQLAATLHAALGYFVVDPFASRVWIARDDL